jgi:SOS response regulatory protein OraA/RecX
MDAYTLALTLLSSRELSETQLRARLRKRKIDNEQMIARSTTGASRSRSRAWRV